MAGDHVRVWVDKWIPSLPSGHPTPLEDDETRGSLVVSSIIDHENSSWQLDSITDLLSTEDRETILTTPINDPMKYDRLTGTSNETQVAHQKVCHIPFMPFLWFIRGIDEAPTATLPLLKLLDTNHGSKEKRQKALSILAFTYWHIWKVAPITLIVDHYSIALLSLDLPTSEFYENYCCFPIPRRVIKASEVCLAEIDDCSWEAFPFLSRICGLRNSFAACDWSWAPRSANQTADFVVSHSGAEMCDNV
ncbi:hypothetical protein FF2_023986 [Malus domestica]